jgi:type II secretory pathway predicted ATPase ExeA
MSEKYIEYWGLKQHPFLLAPDSQMMYMAGQYFECLERLKYAINTNKGGVLIISEDAGLGKTTILLKLIDEMRGEYGESFRYALIDHPTINADQLIAHITEGISGIKPYEDKSKNLLLLKSSLTEVKKRGGKNIIIVDEGQMLCGAKDVLQELRVLINLTYNNEYLHTFILSGQKPLWDEIKNMPEFWQRLPVRYYFFPLRLEETKELIKFRLLKAGIDNGKEIFTNDAFEIIQRYSKGSPRTIIALADLSLLMGFSDHSRKISFKEMSKAINAMAGKGESLPYVVEDVKKHSETPLATFSNTNKDNDSMKQIIGYIAQEKKNNFRNMSVTDQIRPFFIVLAIIFSIIAGSLAGYLYTNRDKADNGQIVVRKEVVKTESEKPKPETIENKAVQEKAPEVKEKPVKYVVVNTSIANIRERPDLASHRVGMIFEGEVVKAVDETSGPDGHKWYKFYLYGDREAWISGKVVTLSRRPTPVLP